MHTEDTVYHLHGGGDPAVGLAATREAFAAALAQWPDLSFERTQVYIGEQHFVSQYRMSATAEGRRIVCDGVDVFAVNGGKIARKDTYLDWPAIQQQLAETPRASAPA
jgi:ketosteroid isomerase-like protein